MVSAPSVPMQMTVATPVAQVAAVHDESRGNDVTFSMSTASRRLDMGVAEWQRMIDQARRETRDMKALESRIKWGMKREDVTAQTTSKRATAQEIMKWRQDQQEEMITYTREKKKVQKKVELLE